VAGPRLILGRLLAANVAFAYVRLQSCRPSTT
jgi:hypothetical protein